MLTHEYLSLQRAGLAMGETWTHRGHGLLFIFPHAGVGSCVSRDAVRPVHAGDVLLLSAPLRSVLLADQRSGIEFSFFTLKIEQLFPLFANHEIGLLHSLTEELKNGRHHDASTRIAEESHRLVAEIPRDLNLDHRGQLLRVVTVILTAEFETTTARQLRFPRDSDRVSDVFARLSYSDLINLSVTDLAKRFHCSKRHLNRLFQRYFGVSVSGLRREIRLLKATTLLRDPNAKVIRVAEESGFNNLGLFNVAFKRRFGLSPLGWRKLDCESQGAPVRSKTSPACPIHSNGLCPRASEMSHF